MKGSVPLRSLVGQQFALLLGLIVALSSAIGWIAYSSLREVIVNDANRSARVNAKTKEIGLKAELSETLGRRHAMTTRMLAQLYEACGGGGGLLNSTCALRKLKTFQGTEGLISALVITPRGRHVSFGPRIDNKQILGELPRGQLAVFESETTSSPTYLIKTQSNNRTLIARFPMGTLPRALTDRRSERSSSGEIPPEAFAPLNELRNRIVLLTIVFAAVAFVLSLVFARRWRRSDDFQEGAGQSLESSPKSDAEFEARSESQRVAESIPALQSAYESLAADDRTNQIMLKLARLTQVEMKKEKVNLSEIALHILRQLRDTDPTRAVTVKIQPELFAEGDPTLLGTVVENLLINAWKFTVRRPDARVEIGELMRGQTRVYFVRDNGIGLNTDSPEKLFDAFQSGGIGIGLVTARRILRRHAGDIWAEGKPGKGATFFFTVGQPKPQEASFVA